MTLGKWKDERGSRRSQTVKGFFRANPMLSAFTVPLHEVCFLKARSHPQHLVSLPSGPHHTRHLLIHPTASQQDRHNHAQHKHTGGTEAEPDRGACAGSGTSRWRSLSSCPRRSAAHPDSQPHHRSAHYPESSAFVLTQAGGNRERRNPRGTQRQRARKQPDTAVTWANRRGT